MLCHSTMLIVPPKAGGGIFDFGKSIFKKVLQSGLAKKALQAVNSDLGKKVLKTAKTIAESELGQELRNHAVNEINKKVQEGLEKVNLPDSVKTIANSDIGRRLQRKVVSEIGDSADKFRSEFGVGPSRKRARTSAKESLSKLGLVGAKAPKRKRRGKSRGRGVAYPDKLLSQFKKGPVILE